MNNLTKIKQQLLKISKHPYFTFIVFGLGLIYIQFLTTIGVLQFSLGVALTQTMIYSIVAIGFSYLLGYAGLASLGTAGFVGLGAYLTGFLIRNYVDLPFLVIVLAVLAVSLIIGLVVGFISLRIEGLFLAIVTLGLSEVFYQVFLNGGELTGGPNGLTLRRFPVIFNYQFDRASMMYLVTFILIFIIYITYNLINSPTGRAMLAMKNSTAAAQAMGISLMKYRLIAFVLANVYAGLAGILYMTFVRYTDPFTWSILFSLNILAAVIFGGTRSIWGTMIGVFLVFGVVPMFLQDVAFLRNNSWLFNVIIGVSIILIVLYYNGGIIQFLKEMKIKVLKLLSDLRGKFYVKQK
jgi:branched-chain amino acid transport system permease protein